MADAIHGITSSSIWSRLILASKPSSLAAFAVAGARRYLGQPPAAVRVNLGGARRGRDPLIAGPALQ
jgi:hypothetical protein